ncbi:alpha-D-ribose 1-methylphosphonate 5-triphosphate diphosphatase [Cognatishimia sp. SS12]|uniref:alpha-D-ribose 1-methylphosphonate 5-triphosphate diphosphatase n=1 Tax=Cognatishimia sp. SS12 TaxID=2979465 RepID=UPI00232BB78A|nr:alpha-D-ribose 1-methylphosphonate 5-triphosphate diphosphatase [Cognatishimia sp. SS12]MDC0738683.1 alpha-D-ribose 1-methylphosphonate 5-triphosphate diphosphatase [Cognatishimia sp. SS12]
MNTPVTSANLQSGRSPERQEFCLANASIVMPDHVLRGALTIVDGVIADIREGDAVPLGAVDCGGDVLMPGAVELHTDNLERHIQPRPKVDWPHDAAILAHDGELAGCGITTVFDAMRVGSIPTGKGRYRKYARELSREMMALRDRGALKISHYLHLRAEVCSETLVAELAEFDAEDRVGIVSLMDHTPGQRQFRNLDKFKAYVATKNGLSDQEFEAHCQRLYDLRQQFGDLHESKTVTEAARFGAVLASHDDTTSAQVAVSAAHGIRLAEFPTTIEAAEACRDAGIAIMMGAPNIIRGGSHSGNVSALELADLGLLDIVSSDYVPAALLLSAFRLAAVWDDLPRAVRTITEAPAQASALHDRGRVETGLRADLLRVATVADTPVVRGVWSQGRQVG